MTQARPPGERARIGVAYAGFVLIGIAASGGGVLIPAQITDYGVNKTTIGLMFLAFSAGYVTSAVSSGSLMHRFGLRVCLFMGAGTMLVAWTGVGLRPPFWAFIALQLVAGFGGGAVEAGLNAHLSGLTRPAVLLNSLHAFFGVGALLGPLIAGEILSRAMSWTTFYLLFAALLAPFMVALLVFPRGDAPAASVPRPRLTEALGLRAVWLAGAFLAVYVGLEISLGNWGFSFLTEVRGQQIRLASSVMAAYWAGLTVGRLVLARIADRIGLSLVGLIACCLAGTAAGSLAVWLVPSAAVASAGMVLIGLFLGPLFPTTIAVVPRLVPNHLVGTAIGVLVGLSAAGGALAPFIAGTVAQRLGVWSLLPYGLVLTVLLALVWWAIARRLGRPPVPVPELTTVVT